MGLMIAILRAPELSATSRIDRIWIMTGSPRQRRSGTSSKPGGKNLGHLAYQTFPTHQTSLHFRRLAHDPRQRPALPAAERPALDNRHGVADLGFVLLVVHHEGRRAALGLAVEPVPHLPLDGDDDA